MITFSVLLQKTIKNYKKHFFILIQLSFLFYFIPQILILTIQAVVSGRLVGFDMASLGFLEMLKVMYPMFLMGAGFGAISGILKLLFTFTIIKVLTLKRAGRELTVGEAISESSNHFFAGLGLAILTWLIIFGGFMFLVIPGIILSVYLTFTLYAFIVDGTSYTASWSRSWELVKGNWWRVLGYFLLYGFVIFAIGLAFGLLTVPFGLLGGVISQFNYAVGVLIQKIPIELLTLFVIPLSVIFGEQFYIGLKKEKKIK